MHHEIPQLDARGLRGFAFKMAAVIAVLFGLILPYLFDFAWPVWPWVLAAVLVLWGAVAPATLGPLYRGWMRVGMAVGAINSKIILGLVFYVIIVPAGYIMRMVKKDPMARTLRTDSSSYRVKSSTTLRDHLEKPY